MFRNKSGFTVVETLIVIVIIGILAAIAIPNFIAMDIRSKEGRTKATMHDVQLVCEDYGVQHDGVYSTNPDIILRQMMSWNRIPTNAFTGKPLEILEFKSKPTATNLPPGDIVLYTPDGCVKGESYCVQGVMHDGSLSSLILTAGQ
ncbi:MAG: prepilin-type N-terminal cleavage/methylation domain-containing protein [Candidatus Kerfeldbacteria bacterium]